MGNLAPTLRAAIIDKIAVWKKGHAIDGHDSAVWRYDDFGHLIRYSDYGDESSAYGWEIDHIIPLAVGGADDLANKRPLHCKRNASLGGILGAASRTIAGGG